MGTPGRRRKAKEGPETTCRSGGRRSFTTCAEAANSERGLRPEVRVGRVCAERVSILGGIQTSSVRVWADPMAQACRHPE